MRHFGAIVLWLAATVSGLFGAGWLSLAGVGWADGFFKRSYWDETESGISVAFSVFGLVVWLVLLWASFGIMRAGDTQPSRAIRIASVTLVAISMGAVLIALGLALGWPEPASEFPTPPWNRA